MSPPPPGPPMSSEQRRIVEHVRGGKNVRVIAYAGCGKTTLALLTARADPSKSFLLLTYNRKLCDETREKIGEWGLGNLQCRTYHSHAGHSVMPRLCVSNDTRLLCMVSAAEGGEREVVHTRADCVMLDETQDMSELHRRMLCLVLREGAHQLVVLGDPRQQVYDFMGADTKFLLHCREYFERYAASAEWAEESLTTSYRMTPNICAFVNLLWGIDAVAGNAGPNPAVQYWYLYPFGQEVRKRVSALIDEHGEESVAIISSCNAGKEGRNDPTTHLINSLTGRYNFHLNTENCSYRNKVRVWTREGCKGSTIPVVVVMGFDAYRGKQPQVNKMGVAASRASRLLVVVHGSSYDRELTRFVPQPYVHPFSRDVVDGLRRAGTLVAPFGVPSDTFVQEAKQQDFLSVTDITHNAATTLRSLLAHGVCRLVTPESEPLELTTSRQFTRRGNVLEQDLSAILGTAVPFQLQFECSDCIADVEAMLNPLILPDDQDAKRPAGSPLALFEELESGRCTTDGRAVHLSARERGRVLDGLPRRGMTWSAALKWLKSHRGQIPSLQPYGFINRKRYDEAFKVNYLDDVKRRYFRRPLLPADFMYLASASCAFEGSHHAYNQIGQDFSFIEEGAFAAAASYLHSAFESDDVEFERSTSVALQPEVESQYKVYDHFVGRVDAVEHGERGVRLHEFKVVSELSDEHRVQALVYAALYCEENGVSSCTTVLTNAKTGGQYELTIGGDAARGLIQAAAATRA